MAIHKNMKVTKWMRKKVMRRLTTVEGNRVTARERKIKRTIRWAIIATCAWVIPVTTEYTEHIVIENVHAGEFGEKSDGTSTDGSLITDRVEVAEGQSEETVEAKIRRVFSENPDEAVAIARAESGLNPKAESTTDRMADGRAFSHGLFQINLTVSKVAGVKCNEAFHGRDYKAKVIDEALFDKCVRLAQDVDESIKVAKEKYDGRGNWTAWGAYTSGAYLRHL